MTSTTFKMGQQVYCKNTLNGGIVTNIEYLKGDEEFLEGVRYCGNTDTKCIITFICDDTGKTTSVDSSSLTIDYKLIIQLCKQQIQEYKDAFFRQKSVADSLKNM